MYAIMLEINREKEKVSIVSHKSPLEYVVQDVFHDTYIIFEHKLYSMSSLCYNRGG